MFIAGNGNIDLYLKEDARCVNTDIIGKFNGHRNDQPTTTII